MGYVQIGAVMHNAPIGGFCGFFIDPVARGFRRIVGIERDRLFHAAEYGLFDGADIIHPAKFRQFLKPQILEVAVIQLDGFGLHGVVRAAEHDALSRFAQDDFIGRAPKFKERVLPEHIDRPDHLGKYAVLDGGADLAIDDGVCIGIAEHADDDLDGNKGRFGAAAPALQPVFGVLFIQKIQRERLEGIGNDAVIHGLQRLHRVL